MDVRDRKDDELIRQLFCTTRIFSRTLNGCVAPFRTSQLGMDGPELHSLE